MSYRPVVVMAWVSDQGSGQPEPPLGIWGGGNVPMPSPPIYMPPQQPEPPLGIWGGGNVPMPSPPIYFPPAGGGGGAPPVPTHPIYNPPGIWGGGNVPMPSPPIYLPPQGGGGGGTGIWGPTDPRPSQPIYLPGQGGGGGQPPGIWGGGNVPMPSPPIYFPPEGGGGGGFPPHVSHPIYRPDLRPEQPIYNPPPSFPVLDPDSLPDHPEVPDLNAGAWYYVTQGNMLVQAFVPWPLAITHPDYNPNYPPEENQPGEWVAIYFADANYNGLTWAWIPSQPAVEHHPAPEEASA